jgi:hypothetical protein
MEVPELLEVRAIARFMHIQDNDHKTRTPMIAADAAGCLYIFRGRFGLALDDHQPEPQDVEANGNHVGCKRDIDRLAIRSKHGVQPLLRKSHVVSRNTRGNLQRFANRTIGERRIYRIDPAAIRSIPGGVRVHLIRNDAARAAKLAERIEVTKRRHIGIGGVAHPCDSTLRVVFRLRGSEQRCKCSQKDELRSFALRRYA